MTHTRRTPSLVHEYASMTPDEFAKSIEPKWLAAELLVETFFGYDEFILDAMLPESLPAAPGC